MKKTKIYVTLLGVTLLLSFTVYPQARRSRPQDMTKWAGKYPDDKFFNQPPIKNSLRRILSRADHASIGNYNLITPIKRIGDYLVTFAQIKYSDPLESLSLAFNLKDGAMYLIFWEGEEHRKFSTEDNLFNLPEEILKEMGLKNWVTAGELPQSRMVAPNSSF